MAEVRVKGSVLKARLPGLIDELAPEGGRERVLGALGEEDRRIGVHVEEECRARGNPVCRYRLTWR